MTGVGTARPGRCPPTLPSVRAPRRRLVHGLAGVAGVVAAHIVDYLVVFPDGRRRAEELHRTGHGYWPVVLAVGLVAAFVAAGATAGRGARNGLTAGTDRDAGEQWWERLGWLVGWQVGLFTLLEIGERVTAGEPVAALIHEPQFALGLAVQLVTAVAVMAALYVVERGSERVVARWRSPRLEHSAPPIRLAFAPERVCLPKLSLSGGARAPPGEQIRR